MHLIACSPGAPIHSVFLSRSPQSPPSRPPSIIARGWQAYLVNRGNTLAAYLASKTPTRRDGFIYLIYEQYTFASTHLHSDTFFASSPSPLFSFSHSISLSFSITLVLRSRQLLWFSSCSRTHSLSFFFLSSPSLSLSFFFFFLFFLCLALAGYRDFPLALALIIFFFPLAFSLFLSLSVPANTFKREKSMISGSTLPLSTVAPVDALPRQQLSSPFVAHFSLRVFPI